jgi:hypothetical protein
MKQKKFISLKKGKCNTSITIASGETHHIVGKGTLLVWFKTIEIESMKLFFIYLTYKRTYYPLEIL